MQAVNLVCPHFDSYLAPLEMNIWMVPLFLGKFSDLVSKFECITKIVERIHTFQMVIVDNLPDLLNLS